MPSDGGTDITLPDLIVTPDNQLTRGGASGFDPRGVIPLIQQAARRYGVDPAIAIRVARSEGLGTYIGDKGTSFGAFQLHTGGGLGDEFHKETGLDPSNPSNEPAMIDWSMKNLARTGWDPYHGAGRVGVGSREGIGGVQLGVDNPAASLARIENPLGLPSGGAQPAKPDSSWLDRLPPEAPPAASPWLRLMQLSAIAQSAHIQPVLTKYDPRKGMIAQPEPLQPTRIMQQGTGELPASAQIQRTTLADSALPVGSASASRQPLSRVGNSMLQPTQYVTRLGMRPYYNES